jgi:hypothetical protein
MKSSRSDPHRSNPIHSPATSAFPSSAERGDGATKLMVIDDERMFLEFEVQIRCDPHGFATLGRRLRLGDLFNKVRGLTPPMGLRCRCENADPLPQAGGC